jgi:putative ABC transport system substrate-binding protein
MYAPGRRWRPQQEPANPSNNHLTIKKEYFIMKKVISLVLSVMMMLTMFAGCKASGTAETVAPTAAPTSAATAETAADTTPAAQEFNVAIVQQLDHASLDEIHTAIVAQLQALAEEKGVKVNIQEFNGQNDATVLNQIGAQVVGDGVDLIIPIATLAAQCMVTAADGTDIPIVYAAISDPEAAGLTGLDNVTGTSDALNTAFILDMMLAANPDIKTVGLLYSNSEANSTTPIAEAKAYLQEKQIDFVEKTGNTSGEIVEAAASMVGRVDAVFTPTDNVVMAAEVTVAETLNEAGIPHYTGADSFVAAGAFATCGVNYTELGTYTADMAMDILLGGAVPEFHVMDGGIITVNTETAAILGIDYSVFSSMANTVVEVKTGE